MMNVNKKQISYNREKREHCNTIILGELSSHTSIYSATPFLTQKRFHRVGQSNLLWNMTIVLYRKVPHKNMKKICAITQVSDYRKKRDLSNWQPCTDSQFPILQTQRNSVGITTQQQCAVQRCKLQPLFFCCFRLLTG